ncbi:aminopeptidase P family protein [Dehalococcoidia bacterium]|nr:aminopeptidase P family protein [Dehalococcoidia bacterium]
MNERVAHLRQRLDNEGIDALLISAPENRRYVSGFTGSAGYLVVSQERALLATDFRYWEQAERQSSDFELIKLTQGDLGSWLTPIIKEIQAHKLGFEAHEVSFALHDLLKRALRKLPPKHRPRLEPTFDLIEALRVTKEPSELSSITRAIEIADYAFESVTENLEPGTTEREIAWRLEKSMREQGAESTSFDTIVASGSNAALPHHRPSDKPIGIGEPVIIDMGARLSGYCSDISRTFCFGPANDQFKRVYDIVLTAQETAISSIQSGMSGHDGDKLARDVIEKAGYGNEFGHGTGHGVGLLIHENPRVSRNAPNELTDGTIFTIEPGVYIPGWGGVRIEDIVVLENGRSRDITKAHKRESLPI